MPATKSELAGSIRSQLLASNCDTLVNNLADASLQLQEKDGEIAKLKAKLSEFETAAKAEPAPAA